MIHNMLLRENSHGRFLRVLFRLFSAAAQCESKFLRETLTGLDKTKQGLDRLQIQLKSHRDETDNCIDINRKQETRTT